LDFESREYELVQQENGVVKLFEPLEVEVYLYSSLKKLAVGLRFKFRTMSGGSWTLFGWTGHCPVKGFYEVYLNFGVARVGPDNVRLEVSVLWMT
jgi:hypothetical protein